MDSITKNQNAILERLKSSFKQKVVEAAIPTWETLIRDSRGRAEAYIAVTFGDIQQQGTRNMASSKAHGYVLPVYFGLIGPTPEVPRVLGNKLNTVLLGWEVPHGGEANKRAGGQIYGIPAQQGSIEAYIQPSSFGFPIEVIDEVTE